MTLSPDGKKYIFILFHTGKFTLIIFLSMVVTLHPLIVVIKSFTFEIVEMDYMDRCHSKKLFDFVLFFFCEISNAAGQIMY